MYLFNVHVFHLLHISRMFAIQYKWILFVCFGLALVIMIPMMCVKSLRT